MEQLQDKTYSIDQVFPHVPKGQVELDGHMVKTGRFLVFVKKGTRCVSCGLRATFFKKEKTLETTILNLYGVRNGRHILFTRDHIVPVSRGGSNDITNIQPMCADCNTRKGDYISFENRVKETIRVFKRFYQGMKGRIVGSRMLLKAIWRK